MAALSMFVSVAAGRVDRERCSVSYMLELAFSADDVAAVRFAISPAVELAASLQRARRPGLHAACRPWEQTLAGTLRGFDFARLAVVVSPRRWVPDFVTPFPTSPRTTFADQLADIAATDPRVVARDVRAAHPDGLSASLARRLRDPEALRDELVGVLADWWELALEPWWPRILAVLEADIAHRSEQLARDGLAATLAGLDDRVSWQAGGLRLDVAAHGDFRTAVAGHRLPLVPSVFTRWPMTNVSTDRPPYVAYPSRGSVTVWDDGAANGGAAAAATTGDGVAALLGRGRAAILRTLDAPRTPTGLAQRVGVTPSAVSQHLRVLAAARLVERTRRGRRVTYRRTSLGDDLLDSAAQPGR
jgi:Family of unknown function (DUF5937)/Helix-turn-helix domain